MRFARTLALQFTREILLYSSISFGAVLIVFLSQNLLKRLDQLTMVGTSLADFSAILTALLPMVVSYAFPIALVLGTLLALQRMSGDGEILAMQSHGIGLAPIAIPALTLAAAATLVTGWLILSVEHRARSEMIQSIARSATKGGIIQPGAFKWIGPRLIFVDARDRQGLLSGVVIFDFSLRDQTLSIFAEQGALRFNSDQNELQLTLSEGDVTFQSDEAEITEDRRIEFETLEYAFDLSSALGREFSPTRPRQMSLGEIRSARKKIAAGDFQGLDEHDPIEYELEAQRRFAIPLAPLLLVMAGIPLGMDLRTRGRAWGLLLSGLLIGSYYVALILGQWLAKALWIGSGVATWLPTLGFGAGALILLARSARGKMI
ncbi:MAG: LptF/LptG family permease [Myxococcota bacterium]|nr:LptF/LptG family permease [Myxococcota bacterium]